MGSREFLMADKIRWGIIGTGNIAHQLARGLQSVADAELVAVGSRTQASADKFGDEFGAPHRYASYEGVANDRDVDAVYVATPHPLHHPNTIMCLNNRKAVLVEKPFAMNAQQASEMIATAMGKKVFLMEAMWTRFFPAMARVRELIAEGAIGEPRMLQADFGFRAGFNPKSRLFDPALGGGALLDVGIYPLSLASMIFGKPSSIASAATMAETGVDEQNAVLLSYPDGQIAICSSAARTNTPSEARIWGTDGSIFLPTRFWMPQGFVLSRSGKPDEKIDLPMTGNGYNYEAEEVGRCLRAGMSESKVMPLDESLTLVQTMDTIRAQWGLVYPMEKN